MNILNVLSMSVNVLPRQMQLRLCTKLLSTSSALHRDEFVRDKTIVNLVTLGAAQHGKTTLASRLTMVLAGHGVPSKDIADIDHSPSERENKRSEHVSHMELWRQESPWRYSLADLPGNFTYIKNTLNHLPLVTNLDRFFLQISTWFTTNSFSSNNLNIILMERY